MSPPPLCGHQREGGVGAPEEAEQVHLDHLAPLGGVGPGHRAEQHHAGVVHQDVEPAELVVRLLDEGARRPSSSVRSTARDVGAAALARDPLGQRVEALLAARAERPPRRPRAPAPGRWPRRCRRRLRSQQPPCRRGARPSRRSYPAQSAARTNAASSASSGGSGVLPSAGCARTASTTGSTCSSPAPSSDSRVWPVRRVERGHALGRRRRGRPPDRRAPPRRPRAPPARAPAMSRALCGSITALVSACGVPATRTSIWQTAWCTANPGGAGRVRRRAARRGPPRRGRAGPRARPRRAGPTRCRAAASPTGLANGV